MAVRVVEFSVLVHCTNTSAERLVSYCVLVSAYVMFYAFQRPFSSPKIAATTPSRTRYCVLPDRSPPNKPFAICAWAGQPCLGVAHTICLIGASSYRRILRPYKTAAAAATPPAATADTTLAAWPTAATAYPPAPALCRAAKILGATTLPIDACHPAARDPGRQFTTPKYLSQSL